MGRFCCERRCWSRRTVIPSLSCDSLWRRAMMGRLSHDQEQLLYSFHLDEAVPHDHPVRKIAAVLDLSWVHSDLAPFYPKMGRPSIDPELMIRMFIIGYVFAIRAGFVGSRSRTRSQITQRFHVPVMSASATAI